MNEKRQHMLNTICEEARWSVSYTGRKAFSERVMLAMQSVDREAFVPTRYKNLAYENGPLPIGSGQTISQPYIVALMTDLVDISEYSTVLEIGTGSGYQTAIFCKLVRQVYSIEKIPELFESARQRFKELGYTNIEIHCANGYQGWKENAPYDAIVVTAAATHIPPSLVDQLKPGGRMVIPVGLPNMHQELMRIMKSKSGATHVESVLDVSFVPLVVAEDEILNSSRK